MSTLSYSVFRARAAKTMGQPFEPPAPVPQLPAQPAPVDPVKQWADRQKKKNPYWFKIVDGPSERGLTVDDIHRAVSRHLDIRIHDMKSARRTADVVYPRQIAFYLCRRLTLRSLPEIGRRSGGKDHTTVLHGIRKIEAALKEGTDLHLCASVEFLTLQLGGDPA
jgi:hypothetical protein